MLPNLPPDQQDNYSYAYDVLMDSFGISEKYRGELEDILYYFLLNLNSAINIIYEHEQSVNALMFFSDYQKVKKITIGEFERKHSDIYGNYDPLTECLTVNIHGSYQKAKAVLNYYGIALKTVEFLYNSIKTDDHLLNALLKDYTEIPAVEILESLIKEVEFKGQYEFLADIRVLANDLNEYIKLHLAGVVSRHRYHLIFELLYLCDVFKYIKKINNHKGRYYSISNNPNQLNQYLTLKKVSEAEKCKVINDLFKNEDRSELYKKKIRKRLKEK